jgi:hypothetical protein
MVHLQLHAGDSRIVWPFTVPEQKKVDTNLPILWMTSDFDLKCVLLRTTKSYLIIITAHSLSTELTTFAHAQMPNATLVVCHGDNHCSIDGAHPISVIY